MPRRLICCISLPPATILSVPIFDFATANVELADNATDAYYTCCGKSICRGCHYSSWKSGNDEKCPFCNSDRSSKTEAEKIEEIMKRAEANDPISIGVLGNHYHHGLRGFQQDHAKAIELYTRAADLGNSEAHNNPAGVYHEGGNMKKAKFHFEAAAMAGHETARFHLGFVEAEYGNIERAVKHWIIAASGGFYMAMHALRTFFKKGYVSRESINSTLTAYNNSCAEFRSEARDAYIQNKLKHYEV
jgi:TPR repeat protein